MRQVRRWSVSVLLGTSLCMAVGSGPMMAEGRLSGAAAEAVPQLDGQYATRQASQAASQPVQRVLLLLQGSAAQRMALDALLDAQQTPGSAEFHQWLTPAEFAARFAPTPAQTAAVKSWLLAQGFTVEPMPASRLWIVFSGSRSQVEAAFQMRLIASGSDASGICCALCSHCGADDSGYDVARGAGIQRGAAAGQPSLDRLQRQPRAG